MNKLTKALLVAGSVAVLAACGSSNKTENVNCNCNGQTFGGYSVKDLQQLYKNVYFCFD